MGIETADKSAMTKGEACMDLSLKNLKLFRSGKVRDVYDLGERLLMVSTDRLSAFDHILPSPIPGKGRVLTTISVHWFKATAGIVPNHLISADFKELAKEFSLGPQFKDRTVLVKKAERFDVECVVRGYLAGSGLKEYQKSGSVAGYNLPEGLVEASKLPFPIFTPAIKNDKGHDENITRERLKTILGTELSNELERLSLALYNFAEKDLAGRGLILCDTKFEFGRNGGQIILIDEILTPDSSRIWDAAAYRPGTSPESFDKQFVRDYLEKIGWNKQAPAPAIPAQVVEGTARRYEEALRRITQ